MTGMNRASAHWAVCLNNNGYPASLERRKILSSRERPESCWLSSGFIRVIDESGDDYLYPDELFAPIALPASLRRKVLAAA